MPIYEYECAECGMHREFIQKVSDAAPVDCPGCGARNSLRRLISSPAIQFKGDGWYITDYSSKGKQARKAAKDDSPAPSSAPAASETSAKPAETAKSD